MQTINVLCSFERLDSLATTAIMCRYVAQNRQYQRQKLMPISDDFKQRLYANLPSIAQHFGTPFHIYDEQGIRQTCRTLKQQFADLNFQEYFAVKATPTPAIMQIIHQEGFGFDCSSPSELFLARTLGATPNNILFTSNNTSDFDFSVALASGGCILNLDDISLLERLTETPDLLCFRYNPGERRQGNHIIGNPIEAKFGITYEQIIPAYRQAQVMGVKRFGLHTMIISNERDHRFIIETAHMLLEQARLLFTELGIRLDFINIGGGMGIPYHPDETPLDIRTLADGVRSAFRRFEFEMGFMPRLYMESGRYITGSHGVLVTRAINRKDTYRTFIGVDANMTSLMRPGMYGAYHHIDVLPQNAEQRPIEVVDVVGALCENNDKFAIQRELPQIQHGDLLIIQDTGAHGRSMGFNYNGRLRPKELLLRSDGQIELIRREETLQDYFATLDFKPDTFSPKIVPIVPIPEQSNP
jgi:diaminopimelate decarboxylase